MLMAILVFAGVAALINVTPGLDTLLVFRTTVAHGRGGGIAASAGIIAGCLAWGLATAVGLTALLTASHVAYDTLRVCGAIYLAWLGASALWGARHRVQRPKNGVAAATTPPAGANDTPPSGSANASTSHTRPASEHPLNARPSRFGIPIPRRSRRRVGQSNSGTDTPTGEASAARVHRDPTGHDMRDQSISATRNPLAVSFSRLRATLTSRSRRRTEHTDETTTPHKAPAGAEAETVVPTGRLAAFRAGLGTNLLNPKAGIFYMSLVPQFLPHGAPVFTTTLLFTLIDVLELALWFWVLLRAASALADRIRRPAFRRRMEQISGVVFLGFAANLLTDRA